MKWKEILKRLGGLDEEENDQEDVNQEGDEDEVVLPIAVGQNPSEPKKKRRPRPKRPEEPIEFERGERSRLVTGIS